MGARPDNSQKDLFRPTGAEMLKEGFETTIARHLRADHFADAASACAAAGRPRDAFKHWAEEALRLESVADTSVALAKEERDINKQHRKLLQAAEAHQASLGVRQKQRDLLPVATSEDERASAATNINTLALKTIRNAITVYEELLKTNPEVVNEDIRQNSHRDPAWRRKSGERARRMYIDEIMTLYNEAIELCTDTEERDTIVQQRDEFVEKNPVAPSTETH